MKTFEAEKLTFSKTLAKLKAVDFAEKCVGDAIDAAGTNPTDCQGSCLLPTYPLQGDWDYFYEEMEKWMNGRSASEEHEQIFEDTYCEIMESAKGAYRIETELSKAIGKTGFDCQRDIEGESQCTNQCKHCEEYYDPLKE